MNVLKNNKAIIYTVVFFLIITITVVYGKAIDSNNMIIRRWNWNNLLLMLPLMPFLFLQQTASLPNLLNVSNKKNIWVGTFIVGIIFGLLDVLIIKIIQHPQPYKELPPFLQPFPYSIFLFTSGALEIELYYRMIPITVFLLLNKYLFKAKYRTPILIITGIITSLIEPVMQFPDGAWWFIIYATISGIAMNAWQFISYVKYGFIASVLVRLGHYLIWHILLGVYVQLVEL